MNLSRYELSAVKRTAQIIKPKRAKMTKLIAKRDALDNEINALQNEIDLWEAPIVAKHGLTSEQILSDKSMEETAESIDVPEAPCACDTFVDDQYREVVEPGETFTDLPQF